MLRATLLVIVMLPLSAADAIGPAITRTRQMLFTPFRAGRSWKLAVTSYLARSATIFLPIPLLYVFVLPHAFRTQSHLFVGLLIAFAVLCTALIAAVMYLCTRLQFVMLELILERESFVAPAWRRYGPQSLAWTGFKLIVGAIATAAAAVPFVGMTREILAMATMIKPGQPPPPEFLGGLFLAYGLFLLLFGGFYFASLLLHDITLPAMALRGAGVGPAIREGWAAVQREPGSFAVFALLKLVLLLLGMLMAAIGFELVLLLCVIALVLAGWLLHLAGVATAILIPVGVAIGAAIYLAAVVYVAPLCIGPVTIFLEAHALFFLAGRLPGIAEALTRSGGLALATPPFGSGSAPPPLPPV